MVDAASGVLPAWVFRESRLLVAVAVIVASLNVPILRWPLYPFRLLETWAHELSHGLMALVVGGRILKLQIFRDGSGLATTAFPSSKWRAGMVYSAGYTGAALIGAILLALRHAGSPGRVLSILGGAMALSILLWVRNFFGVVALGLLSVSLMAAGAELQAAWARFLLALLGATVSLNALTAIRQLYGRTGGTVGGQPMPSDAQQVARRVGMPAAFWATGWLLLSLLLVKMALEHPL